MWVQLCIQSMANESSWLLLVRNCVSLRWLNSDDLELIESYCDDLFLWSYLLICIGCNLWFEYLFDCDRVVRHSWNDNTDELYIVIWSLLLVRTCINIIQALLICQTGLCVCLSTISFAFFLLNNFVSFNILSFGLCS